VELAGRVALVTGGSRGIGLAIARAFASAGASVAVCARRDSELQEGLRSLERLADARHIAIVADVSSRAAVASLVDEVEQALGPIGVLVNNAGVLGPVGHLWEVDLDDWEETFKVHVYGPVALLQRILPGMIAQGKGSIINLSGGGATSPRPRFTAYGASKTALVRLTETLATELPATVRVNAIAPGAVNTRMLEDVIHAGAAAGTRGVAEARRQVETGGVPPERAAALALFLASDRSTGLTGRLISAVYDDWEHLDRRIPEVMAGETYTLRRVV